MKIKSLLVGMLACTAMVSCTNDDVLENNEVIKGGEKGYIAVNIARSTGSRAFEDGNPSEHAVKEAIFYFLDGDYNGCANAYTVDGEDLSWTASTANGVTKKATALVVDGIKDEVPAYIVAIMNPTSAIKTLGNRPSLAQLKGVVENYSSLTENLVMSNAVYAAGNNKEVVATPISLENIAHSKKEVESENYKPVTIQVERVVAKVAVDNLSDAISELNSTGLTEKIDDKDNLQLEFVLTGWEVLQNKQSRLVKNIDATYWTINNWNDLSLKRSYWANDYTTEDGRTKYLVGKLTGKDKDYKYVEETVNQTATAASALNSVSPYLLVSGKFVDADTKLAVNLVEWAGQKYTEEGYLNLIAGMEEVSKYYTFKGETTNDKGEVVKEYESFKASLLKMQDNTANDWGATAVLKDETTQFYTVTFKADGKTIDVASPVSTTDVKDAIAKFDEVQYWNGGNTYYFVPIKHQAATDDTNFYGVVRNHVYKMNISSISGYGTPVADPNQYIDEPEKPTEDDSYMKAEIVILDWKVVENEVELN